MMISNEPNKPTILTYHYIYTHKLSLFIATTPMDFPPRTKSIGVTTNKHSPPIPVDIDNIVQPVQQHTSILDGTESRNTNWTSPSPIIAEEF